MNRRRWLPAAALGVLGAGGLSACPSQAVQETARSGSGGQKQDLKKLAASLETKTIALIDAINAKDDSKIRSAKDVLGKEADKAEDAVASETGPTANQINSAVSRIRGGILSNNLTQLEQAKTLLHQAAQV